LARDFIFSIDGGSFDNKKLGVALIFFAILGEKDSAKVLRQVLALR